MDKVLRKPAAAAKAAEEKETPSEAEAVRALEEQEQQLRQAKAARDKAASKASLRAPKQEVAPPPPFRGAKTGGSLRMPKSAPKGPPKAPHPKMKGEPTDDEAGDGLSRSNAKARWRRALPDFVDARVTNPGSRPKRSLVTGIPPEVYEAIKKDVNAEAHWFAKFRKSGCTWDDVDLEELAEETVEEKGSAGMRWATEKQVAKHYDDADMAADLCEEAENEPGGDRVRFHPRFPGRDEYKQFYVDWVEEKVHSQSNSHSKRVKARAAADEQAMTMLMPRLAPPPVKRTRLGSVGRVQPATPVSSVSEADIDPEQLKEEEEAEEAKATAEAERQKEIKRRKEARDKLQATPTYQRDVWMKEVGGVLLDITVQIDSLVGAEKIGKVMRDEYKSSFDQAHKHLIDLRGQMEDLSPKTSEDVLKGIVIKAQTAMKNICTDLKAFKQYYKSYYPDPTPPPKAKAKAKATK